jgi:hypothetical protein
MANLLGSLIDYVPGKLRKTSLPQKGGDVRTQRNLGKRPKTDRQKGKQEMTTTETAKIEQAADGTWSVLRGNDRR